MTVTENTIDIAASPATIYRLASATERWPQILPHYRSVRVISARGGWRLVEMAARHHVFPIRWTAEQTNDDERPHIAFHHVRGWTRGMDVEWTFEPIDERTTRVTIIHRLDFAFPFAARWLGRHLVSDYFVHGVASKTLARMKVLAERGSA